jgi:hypothetical protein
MMTLEVRVGGVLLNPDEVLRGDVLGLAAAADGTGSNDHPAYIQITRV